MQNHRKRAIKTALWIGVPVLVLALLIIGGFLYLSDCYPANESAVEAFTAARTVREQTLDNGDMLFDPGDAEIGLIFYPGGKVDEKAYVPLMRAVAAGGVKCVLCKMPFHLAVLDLHAADGVREAVQDVAHWYIGGHSLGGACASIELNAHPDAYEGLILLAAFADRDLSKTSVRVLSVYGSEDGVLDRAKYESAKALLPQDVREIVIEGGCHAGFGLYGPQKGDGTNRIPYREQIRLAADAILDWLNNGVSSGANADKT